MTLFDFMNSRYVENNIKLQTCYDVSTEGKAKASHALIETQRKFYRRISYIKLLFEFIFYKLGFVEEPKSGDDLNRAYMIEKSEALAKEKMEREETKLEAVPDEPTPA